MIRLSILTTRDNVEAIIISRDDGEVDILVGNTGLDLFIAALEDQLTKSPNERLSVLWRP